MRRIDAYYEKRRTSDILALGFVRAALAHVLSDAGTETLATYYSWEKFARNVCVCVAGNVEDDDMQVVHMNLGRLVDLSEQNFYPSLMEEPFIVNDALSKTRPQSEARRHDHRHPKDTI